MRGFWPYRNLIFFTKFFAVFLLTGCAHFFSSRSANLGEESIYREAAYNDGNRVPQSIMPRSIGEVSAVQDSSNIDHLYLRSQADYHFSLAESLSAAGQTEQAIEEFKLNLVYDPQSALVHLRLAVEYVRLGLIGESIESANQVIDLEPKYIEAHILLAGIYSSLKMYDQAYERYNEVLTINADEPDVPLYIGALLAEQKRYDEALNVFEKQLKKKGENPKVHLFHYYIGQVYDQRGGAKDRRLAKAAYEASIRAAPSFVDSTLALAQHYETGNKAQAKKLLARYQREYGPNYNVAEALSRYYLEEKDNDRALEQLEFMEAQGKDLLAIKVKIALVLVEIKRYSEAVQKLEEVLGFAPDSDRVRFYLGAVHEELKNHSIAIDHYAQLPATSGFYVEAVLHRAYLTKLQGRNDEAMEVVREGIKNVDDNPQLYQMYAALLEDNKAYDQAMEILTTAIDKFPAQTQLVFLLGSIQDRSGKTDSAIQSMKKVLELDNNHVNALNYLAYTYAERELFLDEAETMVRRALTFKPKDPYVLDTLGWVLYKKGRLAEAVRVLEEAFNSKNDEGIIAEHLGDAYYRNQLPEKAKAMYQRVVDLGNSENIEKVRQKIVSIDHPKTPLVIRQQRLPAATTSAMEERRLSAPPSLVPTTSGSDLLPESR